MWYKHCLVASLLYNLALEKSELITQFIVSLQFLDWTWTRHRLHLKSQRTNLSCRTGHTNHCSMHSFKMYRSVLIIQSHLLPSPRVNYRLNQCVSVCVEEHTHHTHKCSCRSISPLMVISERAVLFTAYWISSPMKEQWWYKRSCRYARVFAWMHLCVAHVC